MSRYGPVPFGTGLEHPLRYREFEVPMFLDPPAKVVPYARFLDARGRRNERLTGARTPDPVDRESGVLPAPAGATVEKAAVVAVLPPSLSAPGR